MQEGFIVTLIDTLKHQSAKLDTPESVWQFHDFISTKHYQYKGGIEFDFSKILLTLADIIKQKLIN